MAKQPSAPTFSGPPESRAREIPLAGEPIEDSMDQAPGGTARDVFANPDEGRASRALGDEQQRGDRVADDEQLAQVLQQSWLSMALPDPPKKPGWHRIWLSTTNQQFPIPYYLRLGYRPVDPEEWPNYRHLKQTSGDHGPVIGINEMRLFEISEARYQQIMRYLHHTAPLEEEGKLREVLDHLRDGRGNSVARDAEEYEQMGRPVRAPQQFA